MAKKKNEEESIRQTEGQAESFEFKGATEAVKDEAQEKYDKLNSQYIRLQADFDNYKKRNQTLAFQRYNDGVDNVIEDMLQVADFLDMAIAAQKDESQRKGIELTKKTFMDILAKYNVEEIKAMGEEFNPNLHEAVQSVDDPDNAGKVVGEVKKGYKRGDAVLRHSMVVVAKQQTE
ncbi:MAG: nucleotide exchange factor GrpE [Christensenellales bacterium]